MEYDFNDDTFAVVEKNSKQRTSEGIGPVLSLGGSGYFVLTEGLHSRRVTPHWKDGTLCIGCTTVTREAFEKLREVEE